jgi:hypothetical protein
MHEWGNLNNLQSIRNWIIAFHLHLFYVLLFYVSHVLFFYIRLFFFVSSSRHFNIVFYKKQILNHKYCHFFFLFEQVCECSVWQYLKTNLCRKNERLGDKEQGEGTDWKRGEREELAASDKPPTSLLGK